MSVPCCIGFFTCCFKVTMRSFGRKLSMMLGGIVFFAGAIINGAAVNIAMLIIVRILLGIGIGVGFANQTRSRVVGGWRVSLAGAAVPALFITIGSIFLPDTPNSVIERKDLEKAKTLIRRIHGIDDVEQEYNDLLATSEASNKVEDPWRKLLMRKYRPHLVMSNLTPLFQQITGINVIMFYAPVLFKTLGFGNNASLMAAVITGVVNVLSTFVSIYLVDKKGRRFLFLQGGTQMFIFQCAVGGFIWYKFGVSGVANTWLGYAAGGLVCVCFFVSGYVWSWGPLARLVPSEIFPLEIRNPICCTRKQREFPLKRCPKYGGNIGTGPDSSLKKKTSSWKTDQGMLSDLTCLRSAKRV